ncbi:hypothetical protein BgiBS90_018482, partial [Biomphalaria glabrata]
MLLRLGGGGGAPGHMIFLMLLRFVLHIFILLLLIDRNAFRIPVPIFVPKEHNEEN